MRAADEIVAAVTRRLERTWSLELAGAEPEWPHKVPVGHATKKTLEGDFTAAILAGDQLRSFATEHGLELLFASRRVHGTTQKIPTHLVVPSIEAAARLVGGAWPRTVTRGRVHAATIGADHPHARNPAAALRELAKLSPLDAELAFTAARWFEANHGLAALMTPRQVPIEGLHAKWLNKTQALVANLAGLDDLGLQRRHPARVHLTYLDPDHLRRGGRRHDCVSVGDTTAAPYPVSVVVISENKDTSVAFPQLPGGVSVEGLGRGADAVAAIEWLAKAPHVYYWGDMDQDGLEILNEFRTAGIQARALLMDTSAYEQYRRWGSDRDPSGALVVTHPTRPVPFLTGGELDLYQRLCDPALDGPRRIEQERIPLDEAATALLRDLPAGAPDRSLQEEAAHHVSA